MAPLLVYEPALAHDWPDHPEHAKRGVSIRQLLEQRGLWQRLDHVAAMPAIPDQLLRVHSQRLINQVHDISIRGGGWITGDTYATNESYALACLAAGACITAVDHILSGKNQSGLAIVRPPGHHAERDQISGFCLFNNVALAARHAQNLHGIQRVLIVDFDVHHGNGSQDIFYDDPSVLFISTHMYMPQFFYPGTGSLHEIGQNAGMGATINIPFAPGVGDIGYHRIFTELIEPRVAQFQPEFIIVSAGYDAHWQDPLAQAQLSLTGYQRLVDSLLRMANDHTQGRILFVLEGGYFEPALTGGILNLISALMNSAQVEDTLGSSPHPERGITRLLHQLQQIHLLG